MVTSHRLTDGHFTSANWWSLYRTFSLATADHPLTQSMRFISIRCSKHWVCTLCVYRARSQRSRGLMRGSAAARLHELWVRIPPEAGRSVSCDCCVLSGRGLRVGLINRPEESYWVWSVWVWLWSRDNEEALAHWGYCAIKKCLKKAVDGFDSTCRSHS